MQAYCMKCKVKREMKDAKEVTLKNGKKAVQGVCPTCGTKMFRMGAPKQPLNTPAPKQKTNPKKKAIVS